MSRYPWTVLFQYVTLYLFSHNAVFYSDPFVVFALRMVLNTIPNRSSCQTTSQRPCICFSVCFNLGLLFTPHSSLAMLFPTHSCSGTPGGCSWYINWQLPILVSERILWCISQLSGILFTRGTTAICLGGLCCSGTVFQDTSDTNVLSCCSMMWMSRDWDSRPNKFKLKYFFFFSCLTELKVVCVFDLIQFRLWTQQTCSVYVKNFLTLKFPWKCFFFFFFNSIKSFLDFKWILFLAQPLTGILRGIPLSF